MDSKIVSSNFNKRSDLSISKVRNKFKRSEM